MSRVLVLVACSAGSIGLYAACGLDVLGGTATIEGGSEPSDSGPAQPNDVANNDPDAAPQQETCTAPRTTCETGCTDLKTDPQNCGACGKQCAVGDNCADGQCAVLCLADTTACSNVCVNTKTDPAHCGSCTGTCDAGLPFCANGACVPNCGALTACPPAAPTYCADTTTDPKNCGSCGNACKAGEICKASACVPLCATGVTVGDIFAANMVGCAGKVSFNSRATLCPAGTHVCSADEWVARYGNKKPTYNYWTNQNLGYRGDDQRCAVGTSSYSYYGCNNPMRVCRDYTDPLGNRCNWKNCGYGSGDNRYFGGCQNNTTAGTLCCN